MRFLLLFLASLATAVHVMNTTFDASRLNSTAEANKINPSGSESANPPAGMAKLNSTSSAKAKSNPSPQKLEADPAMGKANGTAAGKLNHAALKAQPKENKKTSVKNSTKPQAAGAGKTHFFLSSKADKSSKNGEKSGKKKQGSGMSKSEPAPSNKKASGSRKGANAASDKATKSGSAAGKDVPVPGAERQYSNLTASAARNNTIAGAGRLNPSGTQRSNSTTGTTNKDGAQPQARPQGTGSANRDPTTASAPDVNNTGIRDDSFIGHLDVRSVPMAKGNRRGLYAFQLADGTVDHDGLQGYLLATGSKYAKRPTTPPKKRNVRRQDTTGSGTVPLVVNVVNEEGLLFDSFYYGLGTVGGGSDPTQQFQFDFDTGSADTWVPGPECTEAEGCPGDVKYDQLGRSDNRTAQLTYGIGSAEGAIYNDDVSIGGLTATNQTFLSVTTAQSFDEPDNNGILGLAFSEIAVDGSPSFFETLIKQGKVQNQEFSFYLARGSAGEGGSQLTLGGRDSSKYTGESTTIPVTQRGFWQVDVDGVAVGDNGTISGTGGPAIIDTGSSLITAPTSVVKAIYAAIPGAREVSGSGGSEYEYPCDTDSSNIPSLGFAGKQFAIAAEDFNLGKADDSGDYCVGAIVGLDLGAYTVGDAFLKNWYSTYSYNAAGGQPAVILAQAV